MVQKLRTFPRPKEKKPFEDQGAVLVISGIRQGDYTKALLAAHKAVEQFKVKKNR